MVNHLLPPIQNGNSALTDDISPRLRPSGQLDKDAVPSSLFDNRLFFAVLTSFILHLLILSISNEAEVAATPTKQLPQKTIQLSLVPPKQQVKIVSAAPEIQERRQASQANEDLPVSPEKAPLIADATPELISKISSYVDFPITQGFMILQLSINEAGEVDGTEVIYTELSRYATGRIAKRFAEASYKPAMKNGLPARDNLMLKIDINP